MSDFRYARPELESCELADRAVLAFGLGSSHVCPIQYTEVGRDSKTPLVQRLRRGSRV